MINLNESKVTDIQFFKGLEEVEVDEGVFETINEYSANIIINERLVVQLSGNINEAHRLYIPESHEQYYNDEVLQDWASENLNIDDVQAFLDREGIENNYDFLLENETESN